MFEQVAIELASILLVLAVLIGLMMVFAEIETDLLRIRIKYDKASNESVPNQINMTN